MSEPGVLAPAGAFTRYAEVAVPVPLRRTFHYGLPDELHDVGPGSVVRVPFGRRTLTGFVLAITDRSDLESVRPVLEVEDPELTLPGEILDLCRWVSDYYLAPPGEVLRAALPAGLGKRGPAELPEAAGAPGEIALDPAQTKAVDAIRATLAAGRSEAFLLHGVTGSGKTEVYLHAAEAAVAAGGKALVLIPEIALSPQMVSRVEVRFGSRVALWHSSLTPSARRAVWSRTRRGEIDVLVGARSAVFAPLPDVRLIVVDEEHESSYKQSDSPRYHARDVALVRGRSAGAAVVLGSATPSLESYANARAGKYHLLELPDRVAGRSRGAVEVVDLPQRVDGEKPPLSFIISDALRDATAETLSAGEQIILFLNRRGHSTVVSCESCREPVRCGQCDIVLTWHAVGARLVCHYCGQRRGVPKQCSECGGEIAVFQGVGTQRVEEEILHLFPTARVERLDTDSTRKRGSLEAALERFRTREADVLLGTQMVAKGLDFPDVTLVGVINADLQLLLPDFRSAERTFQLLTQVAGRSGRGTRPGRVLFQTRYPEHVAITAAAAQDFHAFFESEFAARLDPPYPPHAHLINLLIDGRSAEKVAAAADALAARLAPAARAQGVDLLGPAPQPLSRLKGKHRWHLMLRGTHRARLRGIAEAALEAEDPLPTGVRLIADVDPASLL